MQIISISAAGPEIELQAGSDLPPDAVVEYGVPPSPGNDTFLTNVVRDLDGLPLPVFGPVSVTRE